MTTGKYVVLAAVLATASDVRGDRNWVDVSGSYASNWGPVVLHQRGANVTGEYSYEHGKIEGRMDGNVIRFRWHEDDGNGRGMFVLASDGELVGSWGTGSDDISGGAWRLEPEKQASRKPSPSQIANGWQYED